jgi:hypothetical protein
MSEESDIRRHEREAAEREPAERSPAGEREAGEPAEQSGERGQEREPAPPGMPRQA